MSPSWSDRVTTVCVTVCATVCVHLTDRAAKDSDLYVLTKLDLHETIKYTPDFLEQLKGSVSRLARLDG